MIKLDSTNEKMLKDRLCQLGGSNTLMNIEVEIRFGSIIHKNPKFTDNKPSFLSSVEPDFYYQLKNTLDKQMSTVPGDIKEIFTKELSYSCDIRKIIHTDHAFMNEKSVEYQLKRTEKPHTSFQYEYRLGIAKEYKLSSNDSQISRLGESTFIRYKYRTSYELDCGKIDLTIVHQGKTEDEVKKNTIYEIEFEIKKNNYNSIIQILTFILQIKQRNNIVIDNFEKRQIINEYKQLTGQSVYRGHPRFIGAQAESLHKDQLSKLFKELYSVTDKADGERFFMFIGSNGEVSFIDNNINKILKSDVKSTYKNCIIDGELIYKDDRSIDFYAFDILVFNNIDLRGKKEYLLKERLKKVDECINNLIKSNSSFTIKMKKFIYRNVFIGSEIIMKDIMNKPYDNDGLIFTPMNEPYPLNTKAPNWLKWKPAELNTIDFYSKKIYNNGSTKWELYVQVPDTSVPASKYKSTTIALFDIEKLCKIPNSTETTFETTFDDEMVDPTTGITYKSDTVIEYKWSVDLKKFVPLRTRWDKTPFPGLPDDNRLKKRGNYVTVACNIWNNIKNPITENQLFQMTNSTTEQVNGEKSFFFERMNNFHNKINEYLINKYCKDSAYLLELNSNLKSFQKMYNTKVYTFNNNLKKSNANYLNFKLDLNMKNACNIIKQQSKNLFDCCIVLDVNSFFESKEIFENFIFTLEYNIKLGSKLIVSFIDTETKDVTCINECQIMYNIKNDTLNSKDKLFNNSINLFVNGNSNENNLKEYIMDYKKLKDLMYKYGYSCVESESYIDLYKNQDVFKLSNYEQDISQLYKFCVFEKIEKKIDGIINNFSTEIDIDITKTNQLYTFHPIKTLYDIFDILNCICYTTLKLEYKNKEITCFQDIPDIHIKKFFMTNVMTNDMTNDMTSETDNCICFYEYIYEEDEEKTITYYIIINNGIILNNTKTIVNSMNKNVPLVVKKDVPLVVEKDVTLVVEKDVPLVVEKDVPLVVEKDENNQMTEEFKYELYEKISNTPHLITIPEIKVFLKQLNGKISGKKSDLILRLQILLKK
jgi:hypothetical protein